MNVKKNPMEILKLKKYNVWNFKNPLNGLSNRLNPAKVQINKLVDEAILSIWTEKKRNTGIKRLNQTNRASPMR